MNISSKDILQTVIAIPTRLNSTRLPNKPLALINGLPMIIRVINQSLEVNINNYRPLILVASGDIEIIDVVNNYYKNTNFCENVKCVLTDPNLLSGTDRINQALDILDSKNEYQFVINLQGDLPKISAETILKCLEVLLTNNNDDSFQMSTLVSALSAIEDYNNPNIVKAVLSGLLGTIDYSKTYKALYFTRSASPSNIRNDNKIIEGVFSHIGIYGFKRSALRQFTNLQPSFLEKLEKLEQLRALENNINIGVKIVKEVPLGVDTLEDLEKANLLIK